MNDLQIFNSEQFGTVRTVMIGDEPYFVGKDVTDILGYANSRKAIADHVDEEDKGVTKCDTLGGAQELTVINESGLYSLILSSKLPQAKAFKRWVTSEVLPAIRKNEAYITPNKVEELLLNPDAMIRLLVAFKDEKAKARKLEAEKSVLVVENQTMRPKAEYFDELVDRNLLTNFRETAKQLKVGEREFISFLLGKKYLYRDARGKLVPYADKNKGLFEIKEWFNEKSGSAGTQTLVTPKGRETFRLLCPLGV
mgnify:CR=1 FL=1